MPTLSWLGKKKIVNHHLDVPFHVLDKKYKFESNVECKSNSTDNRIIHGDNLAVLKSLLPEFEGKVDCIYIDPPYNTGEEKWIYNDSVNDPRIQKWFDTVVGKKGEDLSRHDKWLCMIYPRLKLLHQLLADDGLIFISIDDNEQSNLKLILDEIFGVNNFICNFIWEKRTNRENRRVISIRHDYVICFAKNIKSKDRILPLLPMSEEALARYNNPDNDHRGLWKSDPVTAQSGHATASQFYTLVAPNGKKHLPPSGRCWLYSENVMNQAILDGRIWFGSHGNNTPRLKTFLDEKDRGLVPETLLSAKDFGTTESAKNNIKNIFLGDSKFETPKPIKLISFLINLVGKKDAIILDSFAGSGTTAHAVLKLNQEDRGSRQFLLCELEDYAETITAERVRRAMDGYGEGKAKTEGLGGAFEYFELGEPLFLENDLLNESVGIEHIRQYVSYSERIPLEQQLPIENNISPSALGVNEQTLWLFNYDENVVTSLDLDFLGSLNLRELKQRPSQYVIYADKCVLETKFMQDHGITFKRIPRDILRF